MSTLASNSAGKFQDGVCYGELELNQVAFPFTGRIEARMGLSDDFTAADPAQVGMILKVNKATGLIEKPGSSIGALDVFALNYSSEVAYDERKTQLRYFHQYPGQDGGYPEGYFPRLGYLEVGDRFTTSSVTGEKDDFKKGDYVGVGADGFWTIEDTAAISEFGPVCIVEEVTTMADGSDALKLVVVRA